MSFQSRFGTAEWLKPYTDETVKGPGRERREAHGDRGAGLLRRLPETLEELDGENREIFMHHGGEEFAYLPCLNDSTTACG
jgi:ferrochelatase